MDKQIRIRPESHEALKNFAVDHGTSIRSAANVAAQALHPFVVVAVNADGEHDVVEVYTEESTAVGRCDELLNIFPGSRVSVSSREALAGPEKFRKYGPAWKEATGWTP